MGLFDKLHKPLTLAVLLTSSMSSFAQTKEASIPDSVFNKISNHTPDSPVRKTSSSQIEWLQIDSFTINHYGAMRGSGPRLRTLLISLRFENGWNPSKIEKVKVKNQALVTELCEIYYHYMDSIGWDRHLITKKRFEWDKIMHLKIKSPVKFSEEEELKIDLITRCPYFLYEEIGVFLDCNNPDIIEDDIREFYEKRLEYISLILFEIKEVNYGSEIY
ncbi:MAG: hypothetical protein HRT57_07305 [Crocinitomicaceae bacterium]|nr:hypothetical protein [Crocinitomicaceae bacterium]